MAQLNGSFPCLEIKDIGRYGKEGVDKFTFREDKIYLVYEFSEKVAKVFRMHEQCCVHITMYCVAKSSLLNEKCNKNFSIIDTR